MEDAGSIALQNRVWRSVELSSNPGALAEALHQFMPSCTFAVKDDVPTARIVFGAGQTAIEFGRDFLARELADDRDFLFVLMHEIYHHVLGHMRPSRDDHVSRIYRNLANIAADMLVNRAVCQRFFPGGVPLLERMYPRDSLPAALLRPPFFNITGTVSGRDRARLISRFATGLKKMGANPRLARRVWGVYRLAWGRAAPYEVVLERLMNLFATIDPLAFPPIVLLGDHDAPAGGFGGLGGFGGSGGAAGSVFGDKGMARSGGDEEAEEEIFEVEKAAQNRGVAEALRRALEEQSNRWRMLDPVACPGVVCVPGRRDAAFLASGMYPVFYQANKVQFEPEQLAHIYVDVSGSMAEEIPNMFGVLSQSRELIAEPIHEFSERIEDVTFSEFQRGVCRTTGGTDFNAILCHAMDRNFKQIVIFTDGFAHYDDALGNRFKSTGKKLHLVFVDSRPSSRSECGLLELAASVFVLS